MVIWLFLAVPWVCLQYLIVVFPDHTHILFLKESSKTVGGVAYTRMTRYLVSTYFGLTND